MINFGGKMETTNGNSTTSQTNTITWETIVMGIGLYLIVLITIVGNSMVLVAVAKHKRLQTVFNFYVINLAVTDILVAVTAMSFYTTNNVLGYWPFGSFVCGVWIFFDYGMTFASVFTLIIISVDRFWSVTWSVHYRAHHNKKKCLRLIVGVWIFMLILWLPPCIVDRVQNAKPFECMWEPSKNKEFVIVIACLGHHGSFLIMLVCYIKVLFVLVKRSRGKTVGAKVKVYPSAGSKPLTIGETHSKDEESKDETSMEKPSGSDAKGKQMVWTVDSSVATVSMTNERKSNKKYGNHLEPNEASKSELSQDKSVISNDIAKVIKKGEPKKKNKHCGTSKYERNEKRVFVTLSYIFIGYVICWVPFHFVFDVSAVDPKMVPEIIYTITFWMTYLNSTINPFLYNFSSKDFRNAFKEILCITSRK